MDIKRIKIFLLGFASLSFIIITHEFGHFAFCKLFNVRTPVFSIGFGPRLISYKIGETNFQFALLPLGGYVSINEFDLEQLKDSQKLLIMLGGIFFNLIFALLIFLYLYLKSKFKLWKLSNNLKEHNFKNLLIETTPKSTKFNKYNLVGPLGIMNLLGSSINIGVDYFLYLVAIINMNLAVFNLLPIPLLDGSKIFILLCGLKISQDLLNILYIIFGIIFILFNIWLLVKDFKRLKK